jgi:hypothetical protein
MNMLMAASPPLPTRADVALAGLLDIATARLRRQTRYARPLAKGGARAAELEDMLGQSAACLVALARPEAFFMPVEAHAEHGGACIANRVTLEGEDIARAVAKGGRVVAYLLTLNYTQADAFDWLGRDYAAHHVQSDLGSEVLFALGRAAHRRFQACHPGRTLRRIPVTASDACGQSRVWDPARVQALLSVFDAATPGVSVTATGCFQPLNSILGLVVVTRLGARIKVCGPGPATSAQSDGG